MELRHLRYFVAVAQLGSISRAAEKLFIAQPPLSAQIRQLEDEIGTELLTRLPRGVRVTAAGAAFLAEAQDILARADRAKRLARQTNDRSGGLARMGYVPTAGHTVLARLIPNLKAQRAYVDFEVREMTTTQQAAAIRANEIDVGIARPPVDAHSAIMIVHEVNDAFCLAVPDRHHLSGNQPISLAAAEEDVFVSVTRQRGPAFFDQTIGLCTDAGFNPDIRYEASTLYGVLELVAAGLGIALVPASTWTLGHRGLTFRLLKRPTRKGSLAFIQRRDETDELVKLLSRLTAEAFSDLQAELRRAIPGLR